MAMRPLKVSINRSLIDKEEPRNKLAYSHDWEAFELSIEELGAAVQKGWAYGPRWNGTRNRANFCCSDIAVVDIDNAPSLDEILSREPIREHAALVHTTSSHTAEHARARAIFVLPETILRGDEFAATNLSLALRCGGDLSPTSAATGFFGFREADVRIAHRELPAELVRELIAQSLPAIKTRRSNGAATVRSGLSATADQQVKCADGRLVHVSDLNPRVPLHCPYHDDRHASAFTVQNRHGVTGIRCSTCQTTYWPERSETAYDFNDFEAHVVRARDYFERHRDWGPLLSDPDHVIEGLTDCSVSIVDRFATPNELAPGVTLIKSPKGTRKTRGLADLISRAPSVLLIGHRRTLIRHTCERLGLEVYLDHEGSLTDHPRLGICLDSLARIPASERYRIVVLDESEQVLAHLLSDTVEGPGKPGRDRLFIELSHRVQSAERTVALDADMSWITFDTLLRMQTR